MSATITQKILESHSISKEYAVGQEMGIRIDQTLTPDASGTMAFQEFEALSVERVRTKLSVIYIDHNTFQAGPENSDDHRYLQTAAARFGVVFSKAGNGICHQVHLERFSIPGGTLLGADSHTCTSGAMGMIAIGAGGLDVAVAMGGSPFFMVNPKVINIHLSGQLEPWVSAKDIALTVLEMFGTKGNVGCVFEYTGEGVKNLSVPERATIANMGAECGVTTSVFPSDDRTREFLKGQGREDDWILLESDEGAVYDRLAKIELDRVVPMVACPHSPGNVRKVRDVAGLKIDQVCIGSCTNSSYKDLMIVAETLRGKAIHQDVNVAIAPGSRQVLLKLNRSSGLGALIASGVRLQENACGFCMGSGQSPQTEGVSVRTNNRNFFGRSGTKTGQVYLSSPETAAACALKGKITDPRDLDIEYPHVEMPGEWIVDDTLFIFPPKHGEKVALYKGPHMGTVPHNPPLPKEILGEVTIKLGDEVTTDHICPSGSRMKFRANIQKYAEFLFENVDPSFYDRATRIRESGMHNIILAGLGYGQGSSREHAALCPMYVGVRVVLAKSFERIHRANLINFGIIPFTFVKENDYGWIEQGDALEISDIRSLIPQNTKIVIHNKAKNRTFEVRAQLSARESKIILAGGTLPYVRETP